MQKTCKNCNTPFEITAEDLKFYDKISPVFNNKKYLIPAPSLCPDCRNQRRSAFRNERTLYSRKCDKSGDNIISIYSPDKKIPVFKNKIWWEEVDALDYGQDFDFNRPFFEQLYELWQKVPMPARTCEQLSMENSEFCNEAGELKDCYLCFEMAYSEKCLYSRGLIKCYDCVDCLNASDCTECYELIESQLCYSSEFLLNCNNCSDCIFCIDCNDCHNCFCCSNLRNKNYCFENKQLKQDEYWNKINSILKEQPFNKIKETFLTQSANRICKPFHVTNSENCLGDYINNSKNCLHCFSCSDCENCKYCYSLSGGTKNEECMDVTNYGIGAQFSYECQSIGGCPGTTYHGLFLSQCWTNNNLILCHFCNNNTKNCFGCVGLKHKEYCVFNKQYPKEQYESLISKIIEHMQKNKEWGEFFPASLSPFGYNETVAQEYFPLTKEQALEKGYNWHDDDVTVGAGLAPAPALVAIPENIADVKDEITKQILSCESCHKNYKIIPQELKFYKQMNLSIPHKCPNCRHFDRMSLRNPRKLWQRTCAKCHQEIQTTYSPDRPEIIYCEECYLKEVY